MALPNEASVMISSIVDNCLAATVCQQLTQLVSMNRLGYYWSSHIILMNELFAGYITHLVMVTRLCSSSINANSLSE